MAEVDESCSRTPFALTSYATALCLISSAPQCTERDDSCRIRAPYISLVYPFVSLESLPQAKAMLESKMADTHIASTGIVVRGAGSSAYLDNHTVSLSKTDPRPKNTNPLDFLRSSALRALGHPVTPSKFYLTVGQSVDEADAAESTQPGSESQSRKPDLPSEFELSMNRLAILVRESTSLMDRGSGPMKLWSTIHTTDDGPLCQGSPSPDANEWNDIPRYACLEQPAPPVVSYRYHISTMPLPRSPSTESVKSKLRPASDVLNRLRWDPHLNSEEYIVGYEDRFLGALEIDLESWKSESTDEEFVPLHRILYFKRKVGGEIIWDRKKRLDKVFGSGIGEAS